MDGQLSIRSGTPSPSRSGTSEGQKIGTGTPDDLVVELRVDGTTVGSTTFPSEGGLGSVPQAFATEVVVDLTAGAHTVTWEMVTPTARDGLNPGAPPCSLLAQRSARSR